MCDADCHSQMVFFLLVRVEYATRFMGFLGRHRIEINRCRVSIGRKVWRQNRDAFPWFVILLTSK